MEDGVKGRKEKKQKRRKEIIKTGKRKKAKKKRKKREIEISNRNIRRNRIDRKIRNKTNRKVLEI